MSLLRKHSLKQLLKIQKIIDKSKHDLSNDSEKKYFKNNISQPIKDVKNKKRKILTIEDFISLKEKYTQFNK